MKKCFKFWKKWRFVKFKHWVWSNYFFCRT